MTALTRRLAAAGALVAAAASAAFGLAAAPVPKIEFTDTKLKNGLRVIVSEDHAAPVVSVAVTYNVGSRDERKGRTGFAHLFEHMMFKGSENVGSNEHPHLIFANGGSMNGTTNEDRTLYWGGAASQSAGPDSLPRSGPHAVARDHEGEPGEPASGGERRAALAGR